MSTNNIRFHIEIRPYLEVCILCGRIYIVHPTATVHVLCQTLWIHTVPIYMCDKIFFLFARQCSHTKNGDNGHDTAVNYHLLNHPVSMVILI